MELSADGGKLTRAGSSYELRIQRAGNLFWLRANRVPALQLCAPVVAPGPELEVPAAATPATELAAPGEPSAAERREHGLTHVPYQPWCRHCIAGRGREDAHRRRSPDDPAPVPVVQCEYSSLRSDEDSPLLPVLVATDSVHRYIVATPLHQKGTDADKTGVWALVAYLPRNRNSYF